MSAGQCKEGDTELLLWYKSLSPLRVDIVDDFAGKELFAIHGDSLMFHCITDARVDFTSTCIWHAVISAVPHEHFC